VTASKVFDVILGILGLGTVGMLIGVFMGDGWLPVTLALGTLLGAGVGFLGGRGFFFKHFYRHHLRRIVGLRFGWN
jgi:hypothetical protein